VNWDAIVAIVEVVGLIAVVVSLVYLAIQVRQNSQLISQNTFVARSAMVHETSVFYARFFEMIADNSEVASIFRRGVDSKELDRDEITRFEALMEVYFTSLEDMDHQYKSDLYFDEDDDEDLVRFMAPAYRDMLMCTYGSNWWDRTAKARCTPSFYDKIQQIRMAWSAEKN
jgi:heme oxygenase